MPELSSDMEEADLVSWLVKPGDRVAVGDLIAELETEKSTVEFESPVGGTLLEIVVPEGTNGVQVGTVIARIEPDGDQAAAEPAAAREEATGAARPESTPAPEPRTPTQVAAPPAREAAPPRAPAGAAASDVAATPVARRMAEQGVLNFEMEASALLVLAGLAGCRAGVVCTAYAQRTSGDFVSSDRKSAAEQGVIETGLEALHVLAEMDARRAETGEAYWRPSHGLAEMST